MEKPKANLENAGPANKRKKIKVEKPRIIMVHADVDSEQYTHVTDRLSEYTRPITLCAINDPTKATKETEFSYRMHYTTSHPVVTCPECIAKMAVWQAQFTGDYDDTGYAKLLQITLDLYADHNVVWVILFNDFTWLVLDGAGSGVNEPSDKSFDWLLKRIIGKEIKGINGGKEIKADDIFHVHRAILTDGFQPKSWVKFENVHETHYGDCCYNWGCTGEC